MFLRLREQLYKIYVYTNIFTNIIMTNLIPLIIHYMTFLCNALQCERTYVICVISVKEHYDIQFPL